VEVKEVGFEDGSMIYSGMLYVQDPTHPNDPTKKIQVPPLPVAQNQKIKTPPQRKQNTTGLAFLKTSFANCQIGIPAQDNSMGAGSSTIGWIPSNQELTTPRLSWTTSDSFSMENGLNVINW